MLTEQKRELCDKRRKLGASLNGVPCGICGIQNDFATVYSMIPPHIEAQWSWESVERILNTHRTFKT